MVKNSIFRAIFIFAVTVWAGNNGRGNLTGQEKADAIYRDLDSYVSDYHVGVFEGFYLRDYSTENSTIKGIHPTIGVMELNLTSASTSGVITEKFDNKNFIRYVKRRPGVINWHQMSLNGNDYFHTKENISKLFEYYKKKYGTADSKVSYRGAFTNTEAVNSGLLNAAKRTAIINELFRVRQWDGDARWNYELSDMVNWEWDWNTKSYQFRDLYDINDARCDFIPEWIYEKSGIPVWGIDTKLKWISGGTTEHGSYHNTEVLDNNYYEYDEVSPWVQSGDFVFNGRDSRNRTTFRPSIAMEPKIEKFHKSANELNIQVSDEASEIAYYSLLQLDQNNNIIGYAKDNLDKEIKYRRIDLNQKRGVNEVVRYGVNNIKLKSTFSGMNFRLVVTDEGANTSEASPNGFLVPAINLLLF